MKVKKAAAVRQKIKDDKALNVSELALASGFNRGTIARLRLPFIAGKIFYSDFRRILRERQDRHELCLASQSVRSPGRMPAEADFPLHALADKFRAPKSNSTT
jgi:hypothetical protein